MTGWLLYTMMAVFGLMIIDFVIAFFMNLFKGSFNLTFMMDYLKDVLYYVAPLYLIASMGSDDPTGWVLYTFYYVLGIAAALKYLMGIFKRFGS